MFMIFLSSLEKQFSREPTELLLAPYIRDFSDYLKPGNLVNRMISREEALQAELLVPQCTEVSDFTYINRFLVKCRPNGQSLDEFALAGIDLNDMVVIKAGTLTSNNGEPFDFSSQDLVATLSPVMVAASGQYRQSLREVTVAVQSYSSFWDVAHANEEHVLVVLTDLKNIPVLIDVADVAFHEPRQYHMMIHIAFSYAT
jgi:hypothetical protein